MAIQRTLKQKQHTQETRQLQMTYSLPNVLKHSQPIESPKSESPLFGYSASLIYKDIAKTALVTALTLAILVALVLSGRV